MVCGDGVVPLLFLRGAEEQEGIWVGGWEGSWVASRGDAAPGGWAVAAGHALQPTPTLPGPRRYKSGALGESLHVQAATPAHAHTVVWGACDHRAACGSPRGPRVSPWLC